MKDTKCYHYTVSLEKVKSECEDKKKCSLYASNVVFGDPCVGTFKYLSVTYYCTIPE